MSEGHKATLTEWRWAKTKQTQWYHDLVFVFVLCHIVSFFFVFLSSDLLLFLLFLPLYLYTSAVSCSVIRSHTLSFSFTLPPLSWPPPCPLLTYCRVSLTPTYIHVSLMSCCLVFLWLQSAASLLFFSAVVPWYEGRVFNKYCCAWTLGFAKKHNFKFVKEIEMKTFLSSFKGKKCKICETCGHQSPVVES